MNGYDDLYAILKYYQLILKKKKKIRRDGIEFQ